MEHNEPVDILFIAAAAEDRAYAAVAEAVMRAPEAPYEGVGLHNAIAHHAAAMNDLRAVHGVLCDLEEAELRGTLTAH